MPDGFPFPGNERPIVIAYDFDGTLATDTGVYQGPDYIGEPIEAILANVHWARLRGWSTLLWSCRHCTPAMRRFLERNKAGMDYYNENPFRHQERGDTPKLKADVLIDDKSFNPFIMRVGKRKWAPVDPDRLDVEEVMAAVEAVIEVRRRKVATYEHDHE